jgi:hypothetical protein
VRQNNEQRQSIEKHERPVSGKSKAWKNAEKSNEGQ